MTQNAGLYIHIPFCERKCGYCDFYSITRLDLIEAFVQALIKEMAMLAPAFESVQFQTVFFGGGTPSLLSPSQIHHIFDALYHHFTIHPDAEITLEANPGTLNREKLEHYRELGINRLSLGVQSFHPGELHFLGRIHTAEDVIHNVTLARQVGFQNINLDLMTAFPGLTPESFQKTLEQAVALQPEHISCYTLIFEPGTPFHHQLINGKMQPVPDDAEAAFYQQARQFLEKQGYLQYEISNYARGEAFICRHNCIYWEYKPYLGLGPSAHSFYDNQRRANVRSVQAYIRKLAAGQLPLQFRESLTLEQQMFEYIFLHLRLRKGLDLQAFQERFGTDFVSRYRETLDRLLENGFIEPPNGFLKLSEKGWLMADSIATYF
ncbi:MAG: radical SAM family heme chaperone HemW [Calditrichaeota bacterium]|nr:radical SAM family heme chaperone HemW [Calditrichota bacterium]